MLGLPLLPTLDIHPGDHSPQDIRGSGVSRTDGHSGLNHVIDLDTKILQRIRLGQHLFAPESTTQSVTPLSSDATG